MQGAELTSLVNYHQYKDDSPLSKTIGKLREQWEAQKWRMDGLFTINALLSIGASIKKNENIFILNTRTPPDSGNVTSRNRTSQHVFKSQ